MNTKDKSEERKEVEAYFRKILLLLFNSMESFCLFSEQFEEVILPKIIDFTFVEESGHISFSTNEVGIAYIEDSNLNQYMVEKRELFIKKFTKKNERYDFRMHKPEKTGKQLKLFLEKGAVIDDFPF